MRKACMHEAFFGAKIINKEGSLDEKLSFRYFVEGKNQGTKNNRINKRTEHSVLQMYIQPAS